MLTFMFLGISLHVLSSIVSAYLFSLNIFCIITKCVSKHTFLISAQCFNFKQECVEGFLFRALPLDVGVLVLKASCAGH